MANLTKVDYNLIAIHTAIEDYQIGVFHQSKTSHKLKQKQRRSSNQDKRRGDKFSRFDYYDSENGVSWNLVQNKNEVSQQKEDTVQNLFSNITMEIVTKVYLLPEIKKADYFLKIENTDETMNVFKIKAILNTIDSISAVYTVDTNQIKSKNNLIF